MKHIYIASLWESIQEGFYKLMILLDSFIYSFINWIYQIILNLADTDIFTNTEIINSLVNRIYIIIGVIMLFLIAYTLLKSMVNPDDVLKGKQSPVKLITNVIISVVLIALVPTIFQFAREFQSALLKNNTIGKLIVGTDGSNANAETISDGGFYMAIGVFQAFFHPTNEHCQYTISKTNTETSCEPLYVEYDGEKITYSAFFEKVRKVKSFLPIQELSTYVVDGEIEYIWLFSSVAGILVIYVLISYCIEIALRTIKLAVYQLIAPLPILSRLVPGEQGNKVFSNWLKATISTYIEVFIRLAILYFAILVIDLVLDSWTDIFTAAFQNGTSPIISFLAMAFLIIGVVLFVKQAPQILKEITGLDGGKYGKAFMRGVGMMGASLGGGATATIRSYANDKDKPMGRRIGRALTAGLGANAKGVWNGRKIDKFKDIPKAAGKSVSETLGHRADIDAAGGGFKGYKNYYKSAAENKVKDVNEWIGGSFDAQQQILNEVNAFLSDAKAVKSTTEGLVRDKKYLFKMGKSKDYISGNKKYDINGNESLSEIEAMIQTLKSTGDIDDAKIAAALDSDMNKRIKDIGKAMVSTSIGKKSAKDFDTEFMMQGTKGIIGEALPTLENAKSQYEIVQKRYAQNSSLDAVIEFNKLQDKDKAGNPYFLKDKMEENVSSLADQLEIQQARIQQTIKLEQERRKVNDKK